MTEPTAQQIYYTQQLFESMCRFVLSDNYVLSINGMSDAILHNDDGKFKDRAAGLSRVLCQDFVASLKPEYQENAARALAEDMQRSQERYLTLAMEVIEAHQHAYAPAQFAQRVKPRAARVTADGPGGLSRERR